MQAKHAYPENKSKSEKNEILKNGDYICFVLRELYEDAYLFCFETRHYYLVQLGLEFLG